MTQDGEVSSEGSVRMWRPEGGGGGLCMRGTTSSYEVDPVGECVVGLVLAGGMEVRRGRELYVFEPGDICAWDPSAKHAGRPHGSEHWQARLIVLDLPTITDLVFDRDGPAVHVNFRGPRLRDRRSALGFLRLHRALENPTWTLHRETSLMTWLTELLGYQSDVARGSVRSARRDPALRRACDLLLEVPAANFSLAELAAATGTSRHRLTRLFQGAFGLPPHRFQLAHRLRLARSLLERGVPVAEVALQAGFFDQSHLHRHFRPTFGITPARYAALLRSNVQDSRHDAA
jgi:AraC-like DNA-binding protein